LSNTIDTFLNIW